MPRCSPRLATFLVAAVVALSFAYDLMRMPVQVSDALGEIIDAQASPSVWASFAGSTDEEAYLRPLRIAQIKALFDLAGGQHYRLVYRGFHAALLVATVLLFANALRVRTWGDASAAVFALTVLTGIHTFAGTVRESFPINHFLEIAFFCLVALNLAQSRGGWWVDALAVLVLVAASLTLESGLLVWVVVVAAWIAGLRLPRASDSESRGGISRWGVTAVTVVFLAYLGARFFLLSTGTPALDERAAGFGFAVLDTSELEARFGGTPVVFYAYNVIASVMSVLFVEPQNGVFLLTRQIVQDGEILPRLWLPVVSSVATTALIVLAAVSRWRRRPVPPSLFRSYGGPRKGHAPTTREPHHADAYFLVFPAVLVANAVLSYAYTKDEIVSVAGVFYALAAYAAARYAIANPPAFAKATAGKPSRVIVRAVAGVLIVALAGAWAFRSVGTHHQLRVQAFKHRNDWERLPQERYRDDGAAEEGRAAALVGQLRDAAILMRGMNPHLLPRWVNAWWTE